MELFKNEAPAAAANFIDLVTQKYFEGLAFRKINKDERLQIDVKKEGAKTHTLPFEKTYRDADYGSLVMVRKPDVSENSGTEFQILLKSVDDLKDVTVFGKLLTEEVPVMATVRKIEESDVIEEVKVEPARKPPPAPEPALEPVELEEISSLEEVQPGDSKGGDDIPLIS